MIFTNDCIILPWWVSGVITIWSTIIRHIPTYDVISILPNCIRSNWNCQETNEIGDQKAVNYKISKLDMEK